MRRRLALFLAASLASGCLPTGGRYLDDRTAGPVLPSSALVTVARLDYPPGNIAVSRTGRVFASLHPTGAPPVKLVEIVDGRALPYPDEAAQTELDSVLGVRIDAQDRLWALDYARYGRGQPRLLTIDLARNAIVDRYDFPSDVAGFLSMVNDLQVSPDGAHVYIAEASPIRQRPALVVYDVAARKSRRLLERDRSVEAMDYVTRTPERDIKVLGLFTVRIGIDSITLDGRGAYLYYGPFTGDRLYRIPTRVLDDPTVSPDAVAAAVEDWAPKTISDGLSIDADDTVYVTDPEHSAIVTIDRDRTLRTLVKDARLRWPDGLGFGPDDWLYVTCSALQYLMFRTDAAVRAHAPYDVFRIKLATAGTPGH